MRYWALGDVHGCFTALQALVAVAPIGPHDCLVALGDYVDRGPDSRRVLDWMIEREQSSQFVALRGNHEAMMLNARLGGDFLEDFLTYGGDATLRSYAQAGSDVSLDDVPAEHWAFIHRTKPYLRTRTHIFVHANLQPDFPLADQPEELLYWERFNNPLPHESGKTMVCGHTAQKSGVPLDLGHAICIDTWVYGDGWLTCLDVESGRYWQANQRGETRDGTLPSASQHHD